MHDESIQPEPKKRGRPSVDLRGRQFGWLVPLYPLPRERGETGQTVWMCLCTASHQAMGERSRLCRVRLSALKEGKQRSCGCRERTVRSELAIGRRPISVECNVTKNEFIAYGVKPAPEWAKTREEVEQALMAQFERAHDMPSVEELDAMDADIMSIQPQTNSEG